MLSLKNTLDVLVTDWKHFLYPSIVKWIKRTSIFRKFVTMVTETKFCQSLSLCYLEIPLYLKITAKPFLRADVCKYRPEVGKIKFLKNPKKIMYTPLGILVMKI